MKGRRIEEDNGLRVHFLQKWTCYFGQSLVEFTIILPLLCFLFFGLFHIGKILLLKQATLSAARYQAWTKLRSGHNVRPEVLREKFFPKLKEQIRLSPPFRVEGKTTTPFFKEETKVFSSHPIHLPGLADKILSEKISRNWSEISPPFDGDKETVKILEKEGRFCLILPSPDKQEEIILLEGIKHVQE